MCRILTHWRIHRYSKNGGGGGGGEGGGKQNSKGWPFLVSIREEVGLKYITHFEHCAFLIP